MNHFSLFLFSKWKVKSDYKLHFSYSQISSRNRKIELQAPLFIFPTLMSKQENWKLELQASTFHFPKSHLEIGKMKNWTTSLHFSFSQISSRKRKIEHLAMYHLLVWIFRLQYVSPMLPINLPQYLQIRLIKAWTNSWYASKRYNNKIVCV